MRRRALREPGSYRGMEIAVGVFMLLGLVALAYISVRLGQVDVLGSRGYAVYADFPSVGGLKTGASVEIAGVNVGRVQAIGLNDYRARVTLTIKHEIQLQADAIVSIKTKGLIGEKFVQISPGGSDKVVPPGGRLSEVEAPVDLEELISKYVFGKV